jgi:hypothetical protein
MTDDPTAKAVHVLASLHVGDDPAGAAVVARQWFERGWELLGGPLRAAIDGCDPKLAGAIAPRGFQTYLRALTDVTYEDGQWSQFLAELDHLPNAIFLAAPLVPSEPSPEFSHAASYSESPYYMDIRLDPFEPDIISLSLTSRHELLFDDEAGEQRVIAFLEEMVSIRTIDYAEVSYGYGGTELTMLELDLPRSPLESLPEARSVLRGFAWVTVIPAGIAGRLGGVTALAATAAFHRVNQLPHGEVWLQATEHFDDWDDESAAKVFAVLAPFLPAGTTALAYTRPTDSVRPGNAG